MKENFITILDAFKQAGVTLSTAQFSITEYSLNTKLSFKFENLQEFLDFLNINEDDELDEGKVESVKAALTEKSIDPNNFFYVNFYSPKVAEL